jgi:hypothetical protein
MTLLYGALAGTTLEGRVSLYASALSTGVEAQELTNTANALAIKYPVIPAYSTLSSTDQAWWDISVGTITAIRVIGQLVIQNNDGLSQLKEGDTTSFLTGIPSVEEQHKWLKEAKEALGFISSYRASLAASANHYDMFFVGGRTRGPGGGVIGIGISEILPVGWGLMTGSIWGADDSGLALADNLNNTFYP